MFQYQTILYSIWAKQGNQNSTYIGLVLYPLQLNVYFCENMVDLV